MSPRTPLYKIFAHKNCDFKVVHTSSHWNNLFCEAIFWCIMLNNILWLYSVICHIFVIIFQLVNCLSSFIFKNSLSMYFHIFEVFYHFLHCLNVVVFFILSCFLIHLFNSLYSREFWFKPLLSLTSCLIFCFSFFCCLYVFTLAHSIYQLTELNCQRGNTNDALKYFLIYKFKIRDFQRKYNLIL